MRNSQILLLLLLTSVFACTAYAEHRAALVITNYDYVGENAAVEAPNVKSLIAALKELGFRCQVATNLNDDKAIRAEIESFASHTPTRSTALIYYFGRVDSDTKLVGITGRNGHSLVDLMQSLATKGGSDRNFVFVDAAEKPKFTGDLPADLQLTFGSTEKLLASLRPSSDLVTALASAGDSRSTLAREVAVTGKGSVAISSPSAFTVGKRVGDEWVNNMGVVFVWCPAGKYIAGSSKSTPGRYPDETQHEVVMKAGFWLSKYELAHSQVMAKRGPGRETLASHKLHPMTMINHDDAKAMTRNYTAREQEAGRLPGDWQYSLPTEWQWEYAARAGSGTQFHFGDNANELPKYANFADQTYYQSRDVFSNAAHPTLNDGTLHVARVGSFQPNQWGLHDMHGNVAEWCIDTKIRGGSWVSLPANCRSAFRDSFSSRNQQNFIGYRIIIQKTPSK